MSTRTWSGFGRTLEMCADMYLPNVQESFKLLAALGQGKGMQRKTKRRNALGSGSLLSLQMFAYSLRLSGLALNIQALAAFVDRNPFQVFRAGVIGAGTDDLAVLALLDDVGRPPRGAADDENRREHRGWHPQHVIAGGAIPVQVREHLLLAPHDLFHALGNVEEFHVAGVAGQPPGDFLDHLVARIGDGVHGVTEADDDLLFGDASDDIGFGVFRIVVTPDGVESELVGTAVLGSLERAYRSAYRRIHVGTRARDYARRERGRVEFVFGVE